jgi:hypothetical protein
MSDESFQVVEPWDPRAHFLPGIGLGRLGDNSAGIIFFNRNPLIRIKYHQSKSQEELPYLFNK